jgi:hypothetical protein
MYHTGRRIKYQVLYKHVICITGIIILNFLTLSGQMYSEDDSRPIIIRSGLKGAIGYSKLYLNDAVRPFYTTSDYYSFSPNLCAKAGAIVTVQPRFFGEKLQLIFDPAFTKYSYGNLKEQQHGDIVNAVDVDVESLEMPVSLRYSLLNAMHKIQPYIRGGYSFSYFVDTEAQFLSIDESGDEAIKYETLSFDFSKYQDAVSLCLGVEVDFSLFDFLIEFVIEKGDGVHKDKFGDNFLKISNTTSTYLQLGVLF